MSQHDQFSKDINMTGISIVVTQLFDFWKLYKNFQNKTSGHEVIFSCDSKKKLVFNKF